MTTKTCLSFALAVPAFALAPAAAAADGPDPETDRPDRLVMVGVGPRLAPNYPGAANSGIGPFPVVNIWRENEPFPVETPDEAKGIKLLGLRKSIAAGIAFAIAPRRKAADAPAGLDPVGFGVETGLYVEGYLTPHLRLRGEARHGIGSHKAPVGDLALDFVWRGANERQLVTLGPRARFASAEYNRRFFGVDAAAASRSGLAEYRPGGGLYAIGAMAGMYQPLGERWGLFGFAGYDRLKGDAARSPVVRQGGDPDQVSAGLALTYTFRIKR
jgi:outer membrane protein